VIQSAAGKPPPRRGKEAYVPLRNEKAAHASDPKRRRQNPAPGEAAKLTDQKEMKKPHPLSDPKRRRQNRAPVRGETVSYRTKDIDSAGLIAYNLSNWTGLGERPIPWGKSLVGRLKGCTAAVRKRPKIRRRCTSFMSVSGRLEAGRLARKASNGCVQCAVAECAGTASAAAEARAVLRKEGGE
jgi:hypothetical protein